MPLTVVPSNVHPPSLQIPGLITDLACRKNVEAPRHVRRDSGERSDRAVRRDQAKSALGGILHRDVQSDREYLLSGGLYEKWDDRHRPPGSQQAMPVANTGIDLAHAMVRNPKMKVLVQQGYFDLACPYGTVEYFIDHLDVPPTCGRTSPSSTTRRST